MSDVNTPLTEDELDQLADFLDSLPGKESMNIERLDGFFCSLIAGPEVPMPSEYWPKVIGGTGDDERPSFDTLDQAREIMGLMMRHWNTIATTLRAGEVYLPILLVDEGNESRGNSWAAGFLQGLDMRREKWLPLLNDEVGSCLVVPMFALAHEDHPDREVRFEVPSPEKREDLLHLMTAYLVRIYRHFEAGRSGSSTVAVQPVVRAVPQVGRNDLCSCGSGKKYKRCCMLKLH